MAAFLALAIAGLSSEKTETVRGAYVAMELIAWTVILPLAFASLVTGIAQALGSAWGLLQHYWVVMKLALTVVATIVLLLQMEGISHVADAAARTALSSSDLRAARTSLLLHASGGLLVLLAITFLGVYKPRGRTSYGQRKHARLDRRSRHQE